MYRKRHSISGGMCVLSSMKKLLRSWLPELVHVHVAWILDPGLSGSCHLTPHLHLVDEGLCVLNF